MAAWLSIFIASEVIYSLGLNFFDAYYNAHP